MTRFQRGWHIFIVLFGTMLEWAEYTFYAYLAPILSTLFFPEDASSQIALLYTFGVFAVGFLMRPLGAIVFGHIGDTVGRKPALIFSMSLMALATAGIGLCPTYATAGALAPTLLIVFRLLQGLSVGGEYHGAGIFLVEKAHHRPHLTGAWVSVGAGIGTVLGALTATLVQSSTASYAWRVPFIVGAGLYLLCFFFRQQLSETLKEVDRHQALNQSWWDILTHYRAPFLRVMSISALIGVTLYICNIYFITHLTQTAGLTPSTAASYAFWAQIGVVIIIPLAALFSDWHNNAQKQFVVASILLIFLAPIMFWLPMTSFKYAAVIAVSSYALVYGLLCGPMFKLLHDCFPAQLRYRGVGLAWNIAAVLFSGTALLIAQSLLVWTGNPIAPAFYVVLCAIIATVLNIKKHTIN